MAKDDSKAENGKANGKKDEKAKKSKKGKKSGKKGKAEPPQEMDYKMIKDMMTGEASLEVCRWEDDDLGLRAAASSSRLPYDKMNIQEMSSFPDVVENGQASVTMYLYIRNKIIQAWQLESNVELLSGIVLENMPSPYDSDKALVRRVHAFLTRYGFINFGNFHRLTVPPVLIGPKKKKVIVIGCGTAGIAAAKQLVYFGLDVVILEARNRVGGRMCTYNKGKALADLGAGVCTGINGNPMITLMRQVQCLPTKVKSICPIYDELGKIVEERRDKLVEQAFRRLGMIARHVVHTHGVDSINGRKISLGDAYEGILNVQEMRMQRKRKAYWETYDKVLEGMNKERKLAEVAKLAGEEIIREMNRIDQEEAGREPTKFSREILRKCLKKDWNTAHLEYIKKCNKIKNYELTLFNLKKMEPSDVYMNARDKRLLDFHMANLEYSNGTTLNNLSFKHWDQDYDYKMTGSHLTLKEGYGDMIVKLVTPDIVERLKMDAAVQLIEYDENGVSVTVKSTSKSNEKVEIIKGDAIISTIPLGVLKKSIAGTLDSPEFSPPLPEATVKAIDEMGFGVVNKVILAFEKYFWDPNQSYFGHLNVSQNARGEFYLFEAMAGTNHPTLVGLMAGEAALTEAPNEVIVRKVMGVLQSMFPQASKSLQPTEAVITRWQNDPWAWGSFSYIPRGCDGSSYDVLAEPIRARNPETQEYDGPERIFMAGEHTSRCYPATVQGAWMSGIREAGRVADVFLGCPFARAEAQDIECVVLESDDEIDMAAEEEKYFKNGNSVEKPDDVASDEGLLNGKAKLVNKTRPSSSSSSNSNEDTSSLEIEAIANGELPTKRRRLTETNPVQNQQVC